jgi:hypothetical protein
MFCATPTSRPIDDHTAHRADRLPASKRVSACPARKRGHKLVATLRSLGLSTLVVTGFHVVPAAVAYGDETDVVDLLSTGRIKTSATWCYKKPGPERCAVTLHIKDGSLLLDGVGCGSFRVPVNGSNGRQTAKISGNAITVSVAGKNGTGVNTYELSKDLTQCSHTVECPAGFQAKVFSCSVERNAPTQATAQPGSSATATLRNAETSPPSSGAQDAHAPQVDAQSYMEAARDLRDRDPTYNSLSAAVQTFRRAAAGYDAAGDSARSQTAANEAQALEKDIKNAERSVGLKEDQNQCGMLRGNALECYARATRTRPSPFSVPIPTAGPLGGFVDCVTTYCRAMQKANCPMPPFGKDNAGFCFAAPAEDHDLVQQKSAAPR